MTEVRLVSYWTFVSHSEDATLQRCVGDWVKNYSNHLKNYDFQNIFINIKPQTDIRVFYVWCTSTAFTFSIKFQTK